MLPDVSQTCREALAGARRVVVKLGTNALTHATGRFDRPHFEALAEDLAWAAQRTQLIVVSSGAVALGMERLGLTLTTVPMIDATIIATLSYLVVIRLRVTPTVNAGAVQTSG